MRSNSNQMKKLFYITLLFSAVGCKDDRDDVSTAAVGKYTVVAAFYVLDGTTLVQTNNNISGDPVTISAVSGTDKIILDFGDGDLMTGIEVKPSPKGFTFNVNPSVSSSFGFHFTGYAGYESEGSHYHGGFEKTAGQVELWYQYTSNGTVKVTKCNMTKQ